MESNRENKVIGRRALGGDGWAAHLRPDNKRIANKAARKAAKASLAEFDENADADLFFRYDQDAAFAEHESNEIVEEWNSGWAWNPYGDEAERFSRPPGIEVLPRFGRL